MTAPRDPLADWLDTATRPFPESTRGRLHADFSAHYADTLRALADEGHPDPAREALHRLGDPREVRHELERTHYTATELEWLGQDRTLRKFHFMSSWGIAGTVAAALFTPPAVITLLGGAFGKNFVLSWSAYAVFITVSLVVAGLEWALPRRLRPTSATVLAYLLRRLSVVLGILLANLAIAVPNTSDGALFTLSGAMIGLGIVTLLTWPRAAMTLLPKALRNAL